MLVLIGGASGSGKTTLTKLINDRLTACGTKTLVVSIDQYYHSMQPNVPVDWDNVSSIDMDLLFRDLQRLLAGEDIKIPSYDYTTHQRVPADIQTGRPDFILLEGIFALCDDRIRDLADLKIYVDADPVQVCFKRRLQRDTSQRGRSAESVIEQYFSQVIPGYQNYVVTTRKYADLCYINEDTPPTANCKFVDITITFLKGSKQ